MITQRDEDGRKLDEKTTFEVRGICVGCVRTLAALLFVTPVARAQQGQDKAAPLSQVQRLNRAPVNKEVLRVQLPRPQVEKLPNGLTVVLQEDHKLPTVAFTMWIRPGQLADPADLPGLASFTAEMLTRGHRTAHERADCPGSGLARRDVGREFAIWCELHVGKCVGLDQQHATNSGSDERCGAASGISVPANLKNTSSAKKPASKNSSRIRTFSRNRHFAACFTATRRWPSLRRRRNRSKS